MKKIIIFLLLLPAITGYAQVKNLRFYHLSLENGETPIGDIYAMLQDKYGYVWIAGNNQLVRYDGYRTKIYLTKSGPAWHGGANILYQDHEGILWAGTKFYGLMRYDRAADTFQRCVYYPVDSVANTIIDVGAIQEDGSGNIWDISGNVNTKKLFVNCFNKKMGKWHHFSKSDTGNYHLDANISGLYADYEGHIWLESDNGIYEYDSAVHKFVGYLTSEDSSRQKTCSSICEAPSVPGILWMSIYNKRQKGPRFLSFNTHDHTFAIYRHKNGDAGSSETDAFQSIQAEKDGHLWISTLDGLLTFNPKTKEFINYPIPGKKEHSLDHLIFNFKEDMRGNFWCATPSGLFYFNTQTNSTLTKLNSFIR